MSHRNPRRTDKPEQRRRANPNGGESGCGCHPTEFGKPAALGKTRWKRRASRAIRRNEKQAVTHGDEQRVRDKYTWHGTRASARKGPTE